MDLFPVSPEGLADEVLDVAPAIRRVARIDDGALQGYERACPTGILPVLLTDTVVG